MCNSLQPILALLGYPIAGNPAQYMFEKAFVHHELDWRYLSLEVAPDALEDAVRGARAMGFYGGNCADPHKAAIGPYLNCLGRSAEVSGVVNFIRREDNQLIGENTEGMAVLEALRLRFDPAGKRVVLFGAGQMARAVATELAMAGVGQLLVVNRHEEPARTLVEMLHATFQTPASAAAWEPCYALPCDVDVMINATSIGTGDQDEPFPVNLDTLRPGLVVADVATNPPHTWLVRHCQQRGSATIDGLEIFITQAAVNFKLWTGVNPDKAVMREAVEEFLEL